MTPGYILGQILGFIVLFVLLVECTYFVERTDWFQKEIAPNHQIVANAVDTVGSFHPLILDAVRGVDHSARHLVKQADPNAKPAEALPAQTPAN